jgi:hypothetical protein
MWPEAGTATLRKALAALELAAGYTAAEHLPVPWGTRLVDGPSLAVRSLDADSYTAGRASDSKRRASTLSMRPYSIASAAVMK